MATYNLGRVAFVDRGDVGPSQSFKGVWDGSTEYIGNEKFVQAVKYNTIYYVTRSDAGGAIPIGTLPTNTTYWNAYGANYESLATGLLLAELAYIKNLGVEKLRITDTEGNVVGGFNENGIWLGGTAMNDLNNKFEVLPTGIINKGTFRKLYCNDDSGNEVGSITFNSDGNFLFSPKKTMTIAGDLYSQGYDYTKDRSYRYYSSDILCRGSFGAYQKYVGVVKDSLSPPYYRLNFFYKGFDKSDSFSNEITYHNANNYWDIPLYGTDGETAGLPLDILIFDFGIIKDSGKYGFALETINGKQVTVININNQAIDIMSNGYRVELKKGYMAEMICIANALDSVPDSIIGKGWMIGAIRENNW